MRCSHLDGNRRRPPIAFAVRAGRASALRCCFECLHSPRVPTLEKSPFRRTRASDVGAALPCLRPGFPILASRQSRRQIEASIDRGQSSRTHATGHAVESPSRLRWQPRIIVRYSRGPQPRRNTKWRRPRYTLINSQYHDSALRGAWSDRDTNDIFAHCSLIFYFLDFKFSNLFCLSELHPLIWFFLKNSFRKKKYIRKTTKNALAPSIFIVLSIVLKLGTPLLHIQAQNTLLQNF